MKFIILSVFFLLMSFSVFAQNKKPQTLLREGVYCFKTDTSYTRKDYFTRDSIVFTTTAIQMKKKSNQLYLASTIIVKVVKQPLRKEESIGYTDK